MHLGNSSTSSNLQPVWIDWIDDLDPRWYQIYPSGKIVSYAKYPEGRELKHTPGVNGYPFVNIGGSPRTIHSLVARAYLGVRPSGYEVRHLDGNKLNADIGNLAYGTCSQNHADQVLHGTSNRGERQGISKLTEEKVLAIVDLRYRNKMAIKEIAKEFGVARTTVQGIVNGNKWSWLTGIAPGEMPRFKIG